MVGGMVNDPDDIQAQINALREGAKAHRSDTELNRADIDHLLKTGYIDREDIDRLQIDSEVDRHLIAELQADGVLRAEHAAQMEQALVAARVIGAAIGIVMVDRHCSQLEGFEILRKISQDSNRKLRLVADHVVLTGKLP